jgi:hypothetical protein
VISSFGESIAVRTGVQAEEASYNPENSFFFGLGQENWQLADVEKAMAPRAIGGARARCHFVQRLFASSSLHGELTGFERSIHRFPNNPASARGALVEGTEFSIFDPPLAGGRVDD